MAKNKRHNPKPRSKTAAPRRAAAKKPTRPRPSPAAADAAKKDTAPGWQTAAGEWQKHWQEQIEKTRKAAGPAGFSGGQTGLPFGQQAAALMAQMNAPWLNLLTGGTFDAADKTDMQEILTGWLESQRGFLELSLQQMAQPARPMTAPPPGFNPADGLSGFYADLLRQGGGGNPLDIWASMPGLGYTREKHDDLARLYKAWQAHETAQRHYMAEMIKVALAAFIRFEESLKNPPAGRKPLVTLKDIYAHWVDLSEDAYTQFALSDSHAVIYARMVDTFSQLKKETNRQADQWAAQWNLPTRTEVDSLHKSMHDLRRENRDLRRRLDDTAKPRKQKRGKK